jgi:ABC-type nitrate/sulfonate/bicarbonate transport system permease component
MLNKPIESLRRFRTPLGSILALLLLWHFAGSTPTGRLLISQPALMVSYATLHFDEILHSARTTALEASLGLIGAVLFSLGFGLCTVYAPAIARFTYPWLVVSQIIPFVCLAPLIILIFGPGVSGKIVLSALMAFFPVAIGVLTGIREVPPPPLEMMRMMAARRYMIVRHVLIPYSLPHVFAGLRTAAPFSVIGAIVAEFNGAESGIGKDIFIAAKRLEPELMMFGILTGACLSALLYGIVILAERQLGPWYTSRGEQ